MAPQQKLTVCALLVLLCAASAYGQSTMTMKNGAVIDLTKLSQDSKGKCCLTAQEIGLIKVDGDNTIVRMDGSGGKYFVTNDPNCGNSITASAYSTSFSNVYLCGQCKGGCPQVDGGKTLVPYGGSCVKADGKYDITKQCVASAPVCLESGKCGTLAEAGVAPAPAPTPAPAPAPGPAPPAACASFSNLGSPCDESRKICCGGGPKNAKCTNGICVSTFPTSGRRMMN